MRTHYAIMIAGLQAAIAGCSMDTPRTDGPATFTYDCSGAGKGFGDCNDKAAAQCGTRGYTVVSQTGDAASSGGSTQMKRTLVVSCK
jgi:hypothetical protein